MNKSWQFNPSSCFFKGTKLSLGMAFAEFIFGCGGSNVTIQHNRRTLSEGSSAAQKTDVTESTSNADNSKNINADNSKNINADNSKNINADNSKNINNQGSEKPGVVTSPREFELATLQSYPILRLSHEKYFNTAVDLFGTVEDPTKRFIRASPSETSIDLSALVQNQFVGATAIAESAFSAGGPFEKTCAGIAASDENCAKSFALAQGRLLFRRSLSMVENENLLLVFRAGAEESYQTGLKSVLTALLMSPSFLYIIETPSADGSLTGTQIAARLAFLLWSGPPDSELLQEAEKGSLSSVEGLRKSATRMMASPRFNRGLKGFMTRWLDLGSLPDKQKVGDAGTLFDKNVANSMIESVSLTGRSAFDKGDNGFTELFVSPDSYVNSLLAPIFGGAVSTLEFKRISFEGQNRAGILTSPALMAQLGKPTEGSPTIRGAFIRARFLCSPPSPPPPNIAPLPSPVKDDTLRLTQRQRLAAHVSQASCAGCHRSIDGVGFGLETFDTIGRSVTTDMGTILTARGEVIGLEGKASQPFQGARELGTIIASSDDARFCFVNHWFESNFEHKPTVRDSQSLKPLANAFIKDGNISKLVKNFIESPAFRSRGAFAKE